MWTCYDLGFIYKKREIMKFSDLNLEVGVNRTIEEAGFVTPTEIQQRAIPEILNGKDLLASAQTGTGKTLAYLLPALNKLAKGPRNGKGPQILILVPTRELAMQVADEASKFSRGIKQVKTVCIYGGAPYPIQNRQLSRPFEILVATPGRLIDHLERGRVNLSNVEMLVLDEADRMMDMGFIKPVEDIAAKTPATRQTLLFSATLKGHVVKLSKNLLKNPLEITVSAIQEKHENIEQRLHFVDNLTHKLQLLEHILLDPTINNAIIFTSTKRYADELVDELYDRGHRSAALHGDMKQNQRTRTIRRMRDGEIKFLVATDVAARGIDIQTISHVINFDLPQCAEDYVHRIGRTGRAGANGIALTFAAPNDGYLLREIEKFTGQKITTHTIPGMEPKSTFNANGPRKPMRGGPRRGGNGGGPDKSRFNRNRPFRARPK